MHQAHSIRLPKFSNVEHSFLNLVDIPYVSVEYIMILNPLTSKIQELFTGYQVSRANKIICNFYIDIYTRDIVFFLINNTFP